MNKPAPGRSAAATTSRDNERAVHACSDLEIRPSATSRSNVVRTPQLGDPATPSTPTICCPARAASATSRATVRANRAYRQRRYRRTTGSSGRKAPAMRRCRKAHSIGGRRTPPQVRCSGQGICSTPTPSSSQGCRTSATAPGQTAPPGYLLFWFSRQCDTTTRRRLRMSCSSGGGTTPPRRPGSSVIPPHSTTRPIRSRAASPQGDRIHRHKSMSRMTANESSARPWRMRRSPRHSAASRHSDTAASRRVLAAAHADERAMSGTSSATRRC